jgi:hypothetical protein
MARGSFSRNKIQKLQGKGELQSAKTEGPFIEWVGRPEYFRHTLVIEEKEYRYESGSTDLGVEVGEIVVYRYVEHKDGLIVDRRSLGRWIDPASLN